MNIIKLFVSSYLILLTLIEWNSIYCMEEKENSYDIGARYYEGIGVEVDKVEAAKWFRRAAEEDGHVTAQFRLAICYELGEGVNQNKVELVKWLKKAAEQGHIIAQFRTGICYEKGEGVNEDKAEALKWFQKAEAQGNVPAKQRVIKLSSELFGHSNTAGQLNSSHKPTADMSKTQTGTIDKNIADKANSINSTNPISSQNQRKHPRQNNQKQNDQNILSPEAFIEAEEAARKAMNELIAEEEAELRKRKQPRGNSKKVKGKGNEGIKKEEKKEPVRTKQITSLKKATEKPSGDKLGKVSRTKISIVDKPSSVTPSLQTQKQVNASKGKQKGQRDNAAETTQAVDDKHMLAFPETQSEATITVGKGMKKKEEKAGEQTQIAQITSLKKATEQASGDKLGRVSRTKMSAVGKKSPITHSPQTKQQDNALNRKQKGPLCNPAQTTQAVDYKHILSSPETQKEATNNVGEITEEKAVVDVNQLLQVDNQPESISDHQPKPHKQKEPKTLWGDVKGLLRREKIEKQNEAGKRITKENNINTVSSPVLYPAMSELLEQTEPKTICFNPTADTNDGEEEVVVNANQLLQVGNQPEFIRDHQLKTHKQKTPKILQYKVKEIPRKKKTENQSEREKRVKGGNNTSIMRSPVPYPVIANSTAHMNGEKGKTPYLSGQIRYIQMPVPFPFKVPVYIPVTMAYPRPSADTSQLLNVTNGMLKRQNLPGMMSAPRVQISLAPPISTTPEMCVQLPGKVRNILQSFTDGNHCVLIVGGAVRDYLLKRTPADIDIITNMSPHIFIDKLKEYCIYTNSYVSGLYQMSVGDLKIDISCCETDVFYSPPALLKDAMSRAFTVNALYCDLNGKIYDPTQTGISDLLYYPTLRLVNADNNWFEKDPFLLLRATRLAVQNRLIIPLEMKQLIQQSNVFLNQCDQQRLFVEFKRLFLRGFALMNFEKLMELDLLRFIFPKTTEYLSNSSGIHYREWLRSELHHTDQLVIQLNPVSTNYVYAIFLTGSVLSDLSESSTLSSNIEPTVNKVVNEMFHNHSEADFVEKIKRLMIGFVWNAPLSL